MTRNLLISALGGIVRIELDGVSDSDADAVRAAWRDTLAQAPASEPVDAPTVVVTASDDQDAVMESLSQRVTLAAIERRRGDFWMLHAAGVAADDGRVVVMVGPSGRGKTTAARVLGAHFGYVSDETVAIDDEGRVWPFRKPLSMIEQAGQPKVQRAPSELGLRSLPGAPLRLAAIVLLDRREDGPDAALTEAVELGDALEELVPQSSYLTSMSAPLHSIALLAAAAGGIRRVRYRDAESLRDIVDAILAEPAPAPAVPAGRVDGEAGVPAGRVDGEAGAPAGRVDGEAGVPAGRVDGEAGVSRPPEPDRTPGTRYSRALVIDALDLPDPDRIATLQSSADGTGTLHVLAGVAPALWRAASGASLSDLRAAAIAAYGHPDADAAALVSSAVEELIDAGVLTAAEPAWRIREDVAWVDHGDRVVALTLADPGAAPVVLEGSAALIWRALDAGEPSTAAEVAVRVAATVGTEPNALIDDISAFIEALATSSLATVAETDTVERQALPRTVTTPEPGAGAPADR